MKKLLVVAAATLFIVSCAKKHIDKTIPDAELRQAAIDALNELDEEDASDGLPDCDITAEHADCAEEAGPDAFESFDTGTDIRR